MRRFILAACVAAIVGTVPASAADPSEHCDSGVVPASATPAGVGARISSEPMKAGVGACNNGAAVPAPGSVRASADASRPAAVVAYDGDPESAVLACSDGYAAASIDGTGAGVYQSGDGGFTTRAKRKTIEEFAMDTASSCAPKA